MSYWDRLSYDLQRRIANQSRWYYLSERAREARESQRRSLGLAYRTQVAARRVRQFRRYMRDRLERHPSTRYMMQYNRRILDAISTAEDIFNSGNYSGLMRFIVDTERSHP